MTLWRRTLVDNYLFLHGEYPVLDIVSGLIR